MTWGELKAVLRQAGVTDADVVEHLSVDIATDTFTIERYRAEWDGYPAAQHLIASGRTKHKRSTTNH